MSQPKEAIQITRKPTRAIFVGPVQIGGGAPVVVQSMTNTDTRRRWGHPGPDPAPGRGGL